MLTDEQYGRQVGDRLRHEIDDVHASPDLVRRLRRRQVRRTWAIRFTIATPVAAAAVAAAIVLTTAGQSAPSQAVRPGTTTAPPPTSDAPAQVRTVAYVKEQTLKALGQASQYVIFSKDTYADGHHDTWYDKPADRYRNDVYSRDVVGSGGKEADGQVRLPPPSQPLGPIHLNQSHAVTGKLGSDQEITTIDYDRKTWSTSHIKETGPVVLVAPDITDTESVRKAITDGTVTLLGNENVDGIDTLHLQVIGPKREYKIDMWVDGKSYLPVREKAVKSSGQADEFPDSHAESTKYEWLPRTEENLAKLTLTPPPDFKRN
jgi:hypothetical protein